MVLWFNTTSHIDEHWNLKPIAITVSIIRLENTFICILAVQICSTNLQYGQLCKDQKFGRQVSEDNEC